MAFFSHTGQQLALQFGDPANLCPRPPQQRSLFTTLGRGHLSQVAGWGRARRQDTQFSWAPLLIPSWRELGSLSQGWSGNPAVPAAPD